MDFLYSLDALLGIIVSIVTLLGLVTVYFRGGRHMQQSQSVTHAPSPRRRGFSFFSILTILVIAIGGWLFLRGGIGDRDGYNGTSGSRYDRVERRPWRDRWFPRRPAVR